MSEELKTQVSQAMDSASESGTENESENVSSPDVKMEQEPKEESKESSEEKIEDKSEDKSEKKPQEETKDESEGENVKNVDEEKDYLSQIKNLNKAISIEREEKAKLKDDLESVKPILEKMKSAFIPETPEENQEEPKPMTQQEMESWYEQKEAEKQKQEEQNRLKETIDKQVKDMSEKWDGKDGKPKYDDQEVIQWQRDNNKLYLMPEEAFTLMKRDDIIDWETKQVVSKAKKPVSSEKSSGGSTQHTPDSVKPNSDQEVKNAVLEAMSSIDVD